MWPFGGLLGGTFRLKLTDVAVTDEAAVSGSAVAEVGLESTGNFYTKRTVLDSNTQNDISDEWIGDAALGLVDNLYEFLYTQVSSSVDVGGNISFSGPANVWQDLTGTTKLFRAIQTVQTGSIRTTQNVVDVSIREKADTSNVVTARITLNAIGDGS